MRLLFFISTLLFLKQLEAQPPIGHWTFEQGEELIDRAGNFDSLRLQGGRIEDGLLYPNSSTLLMAENYSGADFGMNKTMIIWVALDNLEASGGLPMSLISKAPSFFDAIGFDDGGIEENGWYVGSNDWRRSKKLSPGFVETSTGQMIQMALVHRQRTRDSIDVSVYRNGSLIGQYVTTGVRTYYTGNAGMYFGGVNPQHSLKCHIEEARLYNRALSQKEIQSLKPIRLGKSWLWLWSTLAVLSLMTIGGWVYFRRRKSPI